MDGFAFVSANLQFLSLSYQLLQYLQVPICGQYVFETEDGEECPNDGTYEFYFPYVLPEEETKLSWLASGWKGVSEVSFFSEANNAESLIGSCELHFSTAVTTNDDNSMLARFPVPTAMITILTLLAFASLLVLSCIYRLIRDVATGKKAKMQKGLLDDDGTDSSSDFARMGA